MYEQVGNEFVEEIASKENLSSNNQPVSLNTIEERDIFVDSLLTNLLGKEKIKEKDSLVAKIKFKRHQLELNTKQIKKEEKSKKGKKIQKTKKYLNINNKLKKSLGLYKLDKAEKLEYSKYEKLNEAWKSYAASSLLTFLPKNVLEKETPGLLSEENLLNCLKQIDYHGCYLTVTKSNSKYQIGLSGLVLQDKKNVLYLLTKQNCIKIVPKYGNLFEFELFGCKFTLVGSNMCYRPEIRTTKHAKLKTKNNIR